MSTVCDARRVELGRSAGVAARPRSWKHQLSPPRRTIVGGCDVNERGGASVCRSAGTVRGAGDGVMAIETATGAVAGAAGTTNAAVSAAWNCDSDSPKRHGATRHGEFQ